ncbi:MAG: FAD-dependent oxidoreductase [Magnetococcales bacterium]|nr:FAD-dependent oxidoreductase [Magnetococcales bacterium]
MSENVTIFINDQEVQVPANATIREASEAQGVHIPTFCHDDRLKPFASCFLCVVEVEKARTLLPACSTKVAPGMRIQTNSATVMKSRKTALDLLLSDHAGDCIAPCEATCPANIDIQGYIAHIANGEFEQAVHLIKQRNPLPVVCGRICPHPCESECRRGLVDEPVAINPLKRFSSEYELQYGPVVPKPAPDTGKRVAIVGGGPAGLSAAYYLRQMGHAPEIFEALPNLGGMARYGIPRFRLPWEMMDREIQAILDLGVKVHHNQRLGKNFSIADLQQMGFGAVLLAIGAHKAKPMRIANEDSPGVMGGVDFLRKVVLGEKVEMGRRVAVIGGGDTAMDCARVAKRLGAEVTLLYRRTQAEMPALPMEQHETIEEGVEIRFLTAPTQVLQDAQGKAKGLRVITMVLGDPDESGRRRPEPLKDSDEDLEFDLIIAAIGQDPDMSCLDMEDEKPKVTKWSTFVYDEKTNVTSQEGVFAAGDCSFGPDILIRAIGEGRRAAQAIDLHLNGANVKLTKEYAISRGRLKDLEMADFSPRFPHKKRALEATLPARQRLENGGWGAINMGLSEAQALAEASRCIECGCNARFDCDLRNYSTEYNATEKRLAGGKRKYDEDKRHPLIKIESDKCITCASCVRVCSEVRRIDALAFINRGFTTKIGPNFNDPLQTTGCDACGMCIDVCPTGTLSPNTGKECGPWTGEEVITTCTSCSRGCGLSVKVKENRIVKINSINGDPVNGACICAEGRFAYQIAMANGAKTPPPGPPSGALEAAKEFMFNARQLAVVVSPFLTVEEIYAAAVLARKRGGSLHYHSALQAKGAAKPNGKLFGEGNLALLQRLGAKPWGMGVGADCLVLVNTPVDTRQAAAAAKVIAVGSHACCFQANIVFSLADPLETEGTFLTRDGALAAVRPVLRDPDMRAGWRILGALSEDIADFAWLRKRLANEVPELAAVAQPFPQRLVPTDLTPVLDAVSHDGRGTAFINHMGKMGLDWG